MRRRRGNLTRESYNLILLLVVVEREIFDVIFFVCYLTKLVVWYGQVIRSKKRDLEKVENMTLGRVLKVRWEGKSYSIFSSLVWSNIRFLPWCLFPFSLRETGGDAEECFFFFGSRDCRSTLPSGVEVLLLLLSPIFLLLLFFSTPFKQSDTHTFFGNFQKKL